MAEGRAELSSCFSAPRAADSDLKPVSESAAVARGRARPALLDSRWGKVASLSFLPLTD